MTWEKIKEAFTSFLADGGVKILKALLIFVIGYLLIKIIMKVCKAIFAKTKIEKITQSFLLSILKFALNLILIITILQSLNVATTGLIALISAAGLAISLSLQNSLANLANGIVIITTKPFKEGDYVNINGVEGTVKNIRMLTTNIVTTDNKLVTLPNSDIVTNEVINYNAFKTRRVSFDFDVDYASEPSKIREIILNVMHSNGKVHLDPAPFVALKTLKDSSISFTANCWVDAEDYWDVYYYVMDNVFNEFKRNNVNIPYNQMEVRVRTDEVVMPVKSEKLPERVEKVRETKTEGDMFENLIHNVGKSFKRGKKSKNVKNKESKTKENKDKSNKDEK